MSLQSLSRFYWFVIDTKQVRNAAVFVSLSVKHCNRMIEVAVRSRVSDPGSETCRFKGL